MDQSLKSPPLSALDDVFHAQFEASRAEPAPNNESGLRPRVEELEAELGAQDESYIEYQSIRTAITHLPPCTATEPEAVAERQREKEVIKRRLARLAETSPPIRAFLERTVQLFNGEGPGVHPADPHRYDLLDELLSAQAYRLASWRVASRGTIDPGHFPIDRARGPTRRYRSCRFVVALSLIISGAEPSRSLSWLSSR